ncbi:hypothetical protein [Streptomyces sp. SID3343]|uniref:hypothetical protein n=1 Tax=Streptomyces sp. SID3343 TaxID=2690260 RepID=UPI00136D49FB|nr:hypothetical protein [Streptomyces sp. SID3343]MYV99661.1 hypothetical protein [Streptomyces sp. SID3343]
MTLHHTRYRHAHDRASAYADARLGAIVPALLDGTIEWGHTRPSRAHHTRDALLHGPGREPLPVTASLAYGTTLPELLYEQDATMAARMAAAHDRASHETARASAHRAVLVAMGCPSAPAVLALRGPVVVVEHASAAATLASGLLDVPHRLVDHLDRLWGSLAPLRPPTAANRMAAAASLDQAASIEAEFAATWVVDPLPDHIAEAGRGWATGGALSRLRARLVNVAVRIMLTAPGTATRTLAHGGLDPADILVRPAAPVPCRPCPHLATPHSDLATLLSRTTQHLIGARAAAGVADTVTTDLYAWITATEGPLAAHDIRRAQALRDVLRLWAMDTLTTLAGHLALPPDVPILTPAQRGLAERATEVLDIVEHIAHGLLGADTPPATALAHALARVTAAGRA